MHAPKTRPSALFVVLAACAATAPASAAVVTFYDNAASFAGASITTLRADFEGFSQLADTPGIANPYSVGGVTFTHPSNLYVAAVAGAAVAVGDIEFPIASNVLTASGNEDITLSFGSAAPGAVSFDAYSNRYAPPVITVFDIFNTLIGTYTLPQGPNALGFVGITSDVGIGAVRWLATGGQFKDTAIDNIRVGTAVSGSVPEPSTAALLLGAALAGLATTRRRFRAR